MTPPPTAAASQDATTARLSDEFTLDLDKLAERRALIQAGSGGGKSYLLRLIVEQAADRMPVIIIDPEGEFYTAREVCSMVLVGAGGELPATVDTAGTVARGLLEHACSAIVDLSELNTDQHEAFVERFFGAVMGAPRRFWRPTLFGIDEAHRFCPEGGRSASATTIVDLMSRGRKRGFGGVLLTQRMAKVRKDAAAEAGNVFIGQTTLDLDLKRAADMLGITKREADALRTLPPGTWTAYGPALGRPGVHRIAADLPQTAPPKGAQAVPPVRNKSVLRAIAETVEQSQTDEPLTLEDALEQIERLRSELSQAEANAKPEGVDEAEVARRVSLAQEAGIRHGYRNGFDEAARRVREVLAAPAEAGADPKPEPQPKPAPSPASTPETTTNGVAADERPTLSRGVPKASGTAEEKYLFALRWWARAGVERASPEQIAFVAGLSPRSSTLRAARASLRDQGVIAYDGSFTRLTSFVRDRNPRPTRYEWHNLIREQLGSGTARAAFEAVLTFHSLTQEQLAAEIGKSASSSTVRAALATLRKLGLIEKSQPIRATALVRAPQLTGGAA